MAAVATASRGAPYRGVGAAPYRRNTHQGELPTSRSSDQIHLQKRAYPEPHETSRSYTYTTSNKVPRASVANTGRFNRSVWTKASTWTAPTSTEGSNTSTTTSEPAPSSTRRPSLPRIKLTDSVAAVAHSGAVGAYIRQSLATRRSRSLLTRASSPNHSEPGGGGGSEEGGGGGRLEAVPSYHKSPNAAVPNSSTDRYLQHRGVMVPLQGRGGGAGHTTGGGPTGGAGHYYNTQEDLHLHHKQQALGGTTTNTAGGAGGGRVWGESRLPLGEESEGYLHSQVGHDTSTLLVTAPPPHHHSSTHHLSTISNTSSSYQPLPHQHTKQGGKHRSKAVSWTRYNQELLQGGSRGAHHLTPLHTGSRHTGTGSTVPPAPHRAATRGAGMQHMTQHNGDNRGISNTNFPMIEFRSYTKEPGSSQHRTFTFNLPPDGGAAGGFPPGFPSSVSSISPTSVGTVADSLTSSSLPYHHRLSIDEGEEYDFRARKGSISNELAPGFKQLLRTSTPKRERQPQEVIKRRRVEFRVESPDVLDVECKEPVTAISEKLELNRSPLMGELLTDEGEKCLTKPPKSILKKREKGGHGTGEVKYAKKYQAILVQQGSFKLPSIKDGQHLTLTGRNTKANSGRNTNFSCSREFAAAFETIDNGDL